MAELLHPRSPHYYNQHLNTKMPAVKSIELPGPALPHHHHCAKHLIPRLHKSISAHPYQLQQQHLPLTASAPISTLATSVQPSVSSRSSLTTAVPSLARVATPAPQYCSLCRAFLRRDPLDPEDDDDATWFHHGYPDDMIEDAQDGCPLCQAILDAVPGAAGHDESIRVRYVRARPSSDGNGVDYTERIEVRWAEMGGCLRIAPVTSELAEVLSQAEVGEDHETNSDSAFRVASSWLHTCLTTHDECFHVSPGSSLLPSRVIDVGPADGSQEAFLYASRGHHDYYVALSYRRGAKDTLTTTIRTLENRMECILMDDMSATIQDAVTITRKLGIRYLWVDALCIVQDSHHDLTVESCKMGEIYKNAALTIAAADEADQEEGIFRERLRWRTRPARIDIRLPKQHRALFKGSGPLYAFGDRGGRRRGPLDNRAWALQEILLSSRVLYYGAGELFWDCGMLNASETHPGGIPPDIYENKMTQDWKLRSFRQITRTHHGRLSSQAEKAVYDGWRSVVESYSRRRLTHEDDKLIAVTGLVNEVANLLQDQFIVGLWWKILWGDHMWQELLWSVDPMKGTTVSRPEYFQAPTWSWMSIDGPITYICPQDGMAAVSSIVSEASILDVQIKEVAAPWNYLGRLTVQGHLTKVYVVGNHLCTARTQHADATATNWLPDVGEPPSCEVWCLVIASTDTRHYCVCLVATGRKLNEFERVGVCEWNAYAYGDLTEGTRKILSII